MGVNIAACFFEVRKIKKIFFMIFCQISK